MVQNVSYSNGLPSPFEYRTSIPFEGVRYSVGYCRQVCVGGGCYIVKILNLHHLMKCVVVNNDPDLDRVFALKTGLCNLE